jgi:hypothetical protein
VFVTINHWQSSLIFGREVETSHAQWRSIICKHNARWQHVSRLKASAFCPSWKKTNINKTHQLIPGIGTAILGVMEPHGGDLPCLPMSLN